MTILSDTVDDTPGRAAHYRTEYGFEARITDRGRIVVRAGDLGCLRMPVDLGSRVAAELERRRLRTPIIVDDTSISWRFLTQRGADGLLFDPLWVYQAKQCGPGAEISLPTPGHPGRQWLVAPVGTQRLPNSTMVAITLEQAEQMSRAGSQP